jgi:DNA-binding SARP family transcriptional activator
MSNQAIPPAETDRATAPMPEETGQERYRLSLLGPFRLIDAAGREIAIASKKNRLLLAMLGCAPGMGRGREILATALWSEYGDEQAKSSLRQAMAVLRKELGERGYNILTSLDSKVSLNPDALTVDVDEFTHAAGSPDAAGLRIAVSLWQGEFLQGTAAAEESLEAWLRERREQFRSLYSRALDSLIPLAAVAERVEFAQQLVRLDDLREASHRRLMEAYGANGERALALRHYDKLRSISVTRLAWSRQQRPKICEAGSPREVTAVVPARRTKTRCDLQHRRHCRPRQRQRPRLNRQPWGRHLRGRRLPFFLSPTGAMIPRKISSAMRCQRISLPN